MSGYAIAEAVRAGRETGRVGTGIDVCRGLVTRPLLGVSALWRRLASTRVRFGSGLKIRVSAVRFCPWPLRSSTTTYAPLCGPRRETSLGDILGDTRSAGAAVRPDIWRSRAIYDARMC